MTPEEQAAYDAWLRSQHPEWFTQNTAEQAAAQNAAYRANTLPVLPKYGNPTGYTQEERDDAYNEQMKHMRAFHAQELYGVSFTSLADTPLSVIASRYGTEFADQTQNYYRQHPTSRYTEITEQYNAQHGIVENPFNPNSAAGIAWEVARTTGGEGQITLSMKEKTYTQLASEGYRDPFLFWGMNAVRGIDTVPVREYNSNITGTKTLADLPEGTVDVFMPVGKVLKVKYENAKLLMDYNTGELGVYQEVRGQWRLVGGAGRNALQSGMFTITHPMTTVVITPDQIGKFEMPNTEGLSRSGAEAYGGWGGIPLDGRTLDPNTPFSQYASMSNLANYVNPQGPNLGKAAAPGADIPWSIGGGPALQYMDKGGLTGEYVSPSMYTPSVEPGRLVGGKTIAGDFTTETGGALPKPFLSSSAPPGARQTTPSEVLRPSDFDLWAMNLFGGNEISAGLVQVSDFWFGGRSLQKTEVGPARYGAAITTMGAPTTNMGEPITTVREVPGGFEYTTVTPFTTVTPYSTKQSITQDIKTTETPIQGGFWGMLDSFENTIRSRLPGVSEGEAAIRVSTYFNPFVGPVVIGSEIVAAGVGVVFGKGSGPELRARENVESIYAIQPGSLKGEYEYFYKHPTAAVISYAVGAGFRTIASPLMKGYAVGRAGIAEKVISEGGKWRYFERGGHVAMTGAGAALSAIYAADIGYRSTEGYTRLTPTSLSTARAIVMQEAVLMWLGFGAPEMVVGRTAARIKMSNDAYLQALLAGKGEPRPLSVSTGTPTTTRKMTTFDITTGKPLGEIPVGTRAPFTSTKVSDYQAGWGISEPTTTGRFDWYVRQPVTRAAHKPFDMIKNDYNFFVQEHTTSIPTKRVLELGVGDNPLPETTHAVDWIRYGGDLQKPGIDYKWGVDYNRDLPYRSEAFDVVISRYSVGSLGETRAGAFDNIYRVTKPGGVVEIRGPAAPELVDANLRRVGFRGVSRTVDATTSGRKRVGWPDGSFSEHYHSGDVVIRATKPGMPVRSFMESRPGITDYIQYKFSSGRFVKAPLVEPTTLKYGLMYEEGSPALQGALNPAYGGGKTPIRRMADLFGYGETPKPEVPSLAARKVTVGKFGEYGPEWITEYRGEPTGDMSPELAARAYKHDRGIRGALRDISLSGNQREVSTLDLQAMGKARNKVAPPDYWGPSGKYRKDFALEEMTYDPSLDVVGRAYPRNPIGQRYKQWRMENPTIRRSLFEGMITPSPKSRFATGRATAKEISDYNTMLRLNREFQGTYVPGAVRPGSGGIVGTGGKQPKFRQTAFGTGLAKESAVRQTQREPSAIDRPKIGARTDYRGKQGPISKIGFKQAAAQELIMSEPLPSVEGMPQTRYAGPVNFPGVWGRQSLLEQRNQFMGVVVEEEVVPGLEFRQGSRIGSLVVPMQSSVLAQSQMQRQWIEQASKSSDVIRESRSRQFTSQSSRLGIRSLNTQDIAQKTYLDEMVRVDQRSDVFTITDSDIDVLVEPRQRQDQKTDLITTQDTIWRYRETPVPPPPTGGGWGGIPPGGGGSGYGRMPKWSKVFTNPVGADILGASRGMNFRPKLKGMKFKKMRMPKF